MLTLALRFANITVLSSRSGAMLLMALQVGLTKNNAGKAKRLFGSTGNAQIRISWCKAEKTLLTGSCLIGTRPIAVVALREKSMRFQVYIYI